MSNITQTTSMDSMEIIRHSKFYSYNGELYANTFPEFWAVHQEPGTGTECNNCMCYGGWNGVFCIYCVDCAHYVYQGTRGGGVYGHIYEGECTVSSDPFAASNTYLKNIKIDDIGDRDICDSRAIYDVSDDNVYLIVNDGGMIDVKDGEANAESLNVSINTDDSSNDSYMRKLHNKAFQFIELEEDANDISPLESQEVTWSESRSDSTTNFKCDRVAGEVWSINRCCSSENETDEEYFEKLEAAASAMDNDSFIIENMNFGLNEDYSEMPALEPISDEDEDEDEYADLPALISISDDEDDVMPPLILIGMKN